MVMVLTSPSRYGNVSSMTTTTADTVKLTKIRVLAGTGAARSIRKGAGLSLSEVAKPVDVSPTTIFRWETGERTPRGEPALRYLELLEGLMGPRK